MSSLGSPSPFFFGGKKAYQVDRSLRFNKSEYHYLTRTPSSTGNQKVWTFSAWIKRTNLANNNHYIYSANNSNSAYFALYFQNDNLYTYFDPGNNYGVISDREFRDVGAWFHLVHQVDAANTTQRVWINGEELSLNSGRNPGNSNYPMNQSGISMVVGTASWWLDNNASDMYLAEVHYSDGNKYTPSDFVETDADTGQLIPKEVAINYGTNGFYLNFSDNSGTTATTLGKDSSGNGNNFTPNNFSVSAGDGNDSVTDTPTLNKATLNPVTGWTNNATLKNGNLEMTGSSGFKEISTIAVDGTSKLYYEVVNTSAGGWQIVGVFVGQPDNPSNALSSTPIWGFANTQATYFGGSYTSTSDVPSWTNNDVVGIKYENGSLKLYKNGTLATATTTSVPTSDIVFAYIANDNTSATAFVRFNSDSWTQSSAAGVDATWELSTANLPDPTIKLPNKHFAAFTYTGTGSSGDVVNITNSDVDFTPDWVWVKTRNVTNNHILTDSVRGGSKNLIIWTNAEESNTQKVRAFIQNGFESGTDGDTNWSGGRPFVAWNWNAGDTDGKTYTVKVVSDGGNKYRFDDFGTSAVTLDLAEGGTYIFDQSDSSNAGHPLRFSTTSNGTHGGGSEYTTGVTTSGTPGSSGAFTQIVVAASAPTLYYYCTNHSGMGGQANTNSTLGSSNFDGSIQTTVKVNASSGFSIVTYTGTGADGTIGHGLGVAPNVAFTKKRSGTQNWLVKHSGVSSGKVGYLDLSDPFDNSGSGGGIISDFSSSSNYSITRYNNSGGYGNVNESSATYVSYVFSEVAGFSKFGSYTGNGSDNGTFVFLGFRPAWVLIKNISSSSRDWIIKDAKIDTFNLMEKAFKANTADAEFASLSGVDFLSNGFKARNNGTQINGSSITYIYFAFAEAPFKNARAR